MGVGVDGNVVASPPTAHSEIAKLIVDIWVTLVELSEWDLEIGNRTVETIRVDEAPCDTQQSVSRKLYWVCIEFLRPKGQGVVVAPLLVLVVADRKTKSNFPADILHGRPHWRSYRAHRPRITAWFPSAPARICDDVDHPIIEGVESIHYRGRSIKHFNTFGLRQSDRQRFPEHQPLAVDVD